MHSKPWGKVKIIRANRYIRSRVVNNPKASCFSKKKKKNCSRKEHSRLKVSPPGFNPESCSTSQMNQQIQIHTTHAKIKKKKKKKLFCSRPNHVYISAHLIISLIEYAWETPLTTGCAQFTHADLIPDKSERSGVATSSSQTAILTEIKVGTGPRSGCLLRQSWSMADICCPGPKFARGFFCTRKDKQSPETIDLCEDSRLHPQCYGWFQGQDLCPVGSAGTLEEII